MVFILDVSYNNVKSGLVHLMCSQMKEIIRNLPIDQGQTQTKMKVGFITYNNTVHFYNIKSTLAQPQMMVVGDVHEMFMPLLDGFLVDPEESEAVIDLLMEQIPKMYGDTRETETILLPAIQAGLEALKASECAGKLLIFHSSLPVSDAPGQLKNRDDRKLLGTEKEKTVLSELDLRIFSYSVLMISICSSTIDCLQQPRPGMRQLWLFGGLVCLQQRVHWSCNDRSSVAFDWWRDLQIHLLPSRHRRSTAGHRHN